jgi:hypothetical protein
LALKVEWSLTLLKWENPRLCRGDSRGLTFT